MKWVMLLDCITQTSKAPSWVPTTNPTHLTWLSPRMTSKETMKAMFNIVSKTMIGSFDPILCSNLDET